MTEVVEHNFVRAFRRASACADRTAFQACSLSQTPETGAQAAVTAYDAAILNHAMFDRFLVDRRKCNGDAQPVSSGTGIAAQLTVTKAWAARAD